jgi:hypothetical protein
VNNKTFVAILSNFKKVVWVLTTHWSSPGLGLLAAGGKDTIRGLSNTDVAFLKKESENGYNRYERRIC